MRLKRLVASVSAGFEDFVTKVENHEAVADCMIDEVRQAAARVRVQHGRVQAQIERFERRTDELGTDERRWNERAVTLADQDEPRALECVRRARRAAENRSVLERQLDEHRRLADDLKARLTELEERLNELQLKRTTLSSRSARAQTLRSTRAQGGESVDAVFERWETAVLTDEYRYHGVAEASDPLEREFKSAEELTDLKARLEELRAEKGGES